MRRLAFLFLAAILCNHAQAQSAKVVQLEHSLRWTSEFNFPNFLSDAEFEALLLDEIGDRLSKTLKVTDIQFPTHFDYRIISWFGKTKIKSLKSSGTQISIASSITRATVGYSMLWRMQVVIKRDGKIVVEKEVEHELEPYSMSIRFSAKPWLDSDEFVNVFLLLLDECLGNKEYKAEKIALGSIAIVRKQVAKIIPISREYKLAVAGGMMTDQNASYKLMKDSIALHDFFYKDNEEWNFNLTFAPQAIFPKIFSSITGIDSYYSLNTKEKRLGTLLTTDGIKRRMRLDWLEEVQKSAIDDEVVAGKIISPIAGQFFEKDSLIAHFIVYSEHKPIENFSIRDAQFQQGEMQDWSASVFTIIGEFRKRPFKVEFSESDAMILISVEGKNQAVLSLINTNPTSLSSGGVRLSKNKRFIVGNATQSKVEVGEAEWYPIYVVEDVDDAAVTEMSFILMLLFFAVGQSG